MVLKCLLTDINTDNIETITVLKGAAATALYGAEAQKWCYCNYIKESQSW